MTRSVQAFVFGVSAGVLIAATANLLPYWLTYRAYNGDGYEVIGFPLVFRRVGGFAGIREFRIEPLIANALIALAFAALTGWVAVRISRRRAPGRGFPVVPHSGGRGTV